MRRFTSLALLLSTALLVVGCGTAGKNQGRPSSTESNVEGTNKPATIVVTTAVLGDIVENLVGEAFKVETIMPRGVSPHDFQPSARQVQAIETAELLVVNGGGFEEGLLKVFSSASDRGVPIFTALEYARPVAYRDHSHNDDSHNDHSRNDHGHEDDGEGHGHDDATSGDDDAQLGHEHDENGIDPHFFTDPARMALVAEALFTQLTDNFPQHFDDQSRAQAQEYIDQLGALDVEVQQLLESVPTSDRKLLMNHGVLGYFADRYNFEIVDTIIPGGGTSEGVGAEHLAQLAQVMKAEGISVIFVDHGATDRFAKVLQSELPGTAVVELYSETLGPEGSEAASYLEMVRSNATRIAEALGSK